MFGAKPYALGLGFLFWIANSAWGGLVVSEFFADPAGWDSPHEYVELVATETIDFAATPYAVVFANNGTGTANGWVEGGSRTYAFNISSGTVGPGEVVYVGGSDAEPIAAGGLALRSIDTATTDGDGFGSSRRSGVLGNGGSNADGIAVFDLDVSSLTSDTLPVDAFFFGDSVGSSAVSATEGYQLPENDHYSGGKLQPDTFVFPGVGSAEIGIFTGQFDTASGVWTAARTLSYTSTAPSVGTTSLSLESTAVPEPSTLALCSVALGGAAAAGAWRKKRRSANAPTNN